MKKSNYVISLYGYNPYKGTETVLYGVYSNYKRALDTVINGWNGFEFEFTMMEDVENIVVNINKFYVNSTFRTLVFEKRAKVDGKIQPTPKGAI